jgi:serine/threonine protein kinase
MAPEQIEGHDADAPTDIFAFGCVVYEMLTGAKAFAARRSGDSQMPRQGP